MTAPSSATEFYRILQLLGRQRCWKSRCISLDSVVFGLVLQVEGRGRGTPLSLEGTQLSLDMALAEFGEALRGLT